MPISLKNLEPARTKWQRKFPAASITSSVTDITALRFNNLTIGKTYRLTVGAFATIPGGAATEFAVLVAVHNSVEICAAGLRLDSGPADTKELRASNSVVFTATANTITFNSSVTGGSSLSLTGDTSGTFVQLEDYTAHQQTSDWL